MFPPGRVKKRGEKYKYSNIKVHRNHIKELDIMEGGDLLPPSFGGNTERLADSEVTSRGVATTPEPHQFCPLWWDPQVMSDT